MPCHGSSPYCKSASCKRPFTRRKIRHSDLVRRERIKFSADTDNRLQAVGWQLELERLPVAALTHGDQGVRVVQLNRNG
jgi:hypothetical protein